MHARTHLLRLQKTLYGRFQASARNAVGALSPSLRRYFERYQREFRKIQSVISQEEMLEQLSTADILVCGDYHTLAQAQRTALDLLRALKAQGKSQQKWVLALEMLPSNATPYAQKFLKGELSEDAFLRKIHYWKNWGFEWKHYRRLFDYAREHQVAIVGLNVASGKNTSTLQKRDEHAARILSALRKTDPSARLFVLFGDLHLASPHLPRSLERRLMEQGQKARLAVVHQNVEAVYWKVAKLGGELENAVAKLGPGRFCILSVAPWVKLQSYLEWLELSRVDTSRFQERGTIPVEDWNDIVVELRRTLAEFLEIKASKVPGFSLQSSQSPRTIAPLRQHFRKNRRQWRLISGALRKLSSIYLVDGQWLCARKPTHTQLAALSSALLHSELCVGYPRLLTPRKDFYRWVWVEALSFLGSKIINPNRRCWAVEDYRYFVHQVPAAENWMRMVVKYFAFEADVLRSQNSRAQRIPKLLASSSSRKGHTELEWLYVARAVGRILGNSLYRSHIDGELSRKQILRLYTCPLSSPQLAAKRYVDWTRQLASSPAQILSVS